MSAKMKITRLTSTEFRSRPGRAKKAAAEGAVYIVRNGTPEYIYITFEHYQRLVAEFEARNPARNNHQLLPR